MRQAGLHQLHSRRFQGRQFEDTSTGSDSNIKIKPEGNKIQKVLKFLWVTTGPKVKEEIFEERLRCCRQCPIRVTFADGEYCGGCGCGTRSKAELNTKLWYARNECPKIPPDFTAVTDEESLQ